MTDTGGSSLFRWLIPIALVLTVGLGALWWLRDDGAGDGAVSEPVSIEATGPRFATLDEIVAASDVIVQATVTAVDTGRSITDPADPTAGIRTQRAAVDVESVLVGDQNGPLVVEQEAELLDGTAVTVNGVEPLAVGDSGLLFLIRGDSDEFPYTALVNEQGWLPVVDGVISPTDPADTLWSPLTGKPPDALTSAPG